MREGGASERTQIAWLQTGPTRPAHWSIVDFKPLDLLLTLSILPPRRLALKLLAWRIVHFSCPERIGVGVLWSRTRGLGARSSLGDSHRRPGTT